MISEIIQQHKKEKERLLTRAYILREQMESARVHLKSDLIKVIIGPRRAGKSVFSFLLLKDQDFAYLNFEDENLLKVTNYDKLLEGLFEVYPTAKFIFFDEIQNLKNWELFVNKLHRRGYNLVLTGSNAKLLSKELATALTGRYIPIEILPFCFTEYLKAKNIFFDKDTFLAPDQKGILLSTLRSYLESGGYPEIIMKELDPESYLGTLFDAVLLKDVVKRYKIRFTQKIYDLALYLISNFTSEYTFTRLRKSLNFNSTNTVQKYLSYLEETFLFFSLNRYSLKMKEQIRAPKKIYLVDNGFVLAKAFQFTPNLGKLLENAIFVELLRAGYQPDRELFYYRTRNKNEVDFVLKKGLTIEALIQACYQVGDERVKSREVSSLVEASEELSVNHLIVITFDYEGKEVHKGKEIKFIPLWKFLTNPKF